MKVFIISEIGINHNGNISLAKKMLEWEPTIQLVDGLRDTIKYFAKTLSNTFVNNSQVREKKYIKKSMQESA